MKMVEVTFPLKLSSDTIILRKLTNKDKQSVFDIYSDEESSKLDDWIPFKTIDQAATLIEQSNKDFLSKSELRYGIEDTTSKKLVGSCGIFEFDEWNKKCMIYYQIHNNERNKGFATEAVRLLINFVFKDLGANKVEAYITPGNDASIKVLEKNGFLIEGLLREMEFYKNKFWDGIVMGILRKDFEKVN